MQDSKKADAELVQVSNLYATLPLTGSGIGNA